MPTAYLTHPDSLLHSMGEDHVESPRRLYAIEDQLVSSHLLDLMRYIKAPAVTRAQLERVHTPAYLDALERAVPSQGMRYFDTDAMLTPHTLEAARVAAGAVVRAAEEVVRGAVDNAFCAIRPPGHHALPDRAMGFCFYNNIAVGAAHALDGLGLKRVAIVDFDVHHGNGTEAIFRNDDRVLFCSSYRHPYYPYSPVVTNHPRLIHSPLRRGSGGAEFRAEVERRWLPALAAFAPEMIFISAGFDAHRDDEMGGLTLVEDDYQWVTLQLMALAEQCCGGRIVSVLEGGYALSALARSVEVHLRALMTIHHG